MLLRHFLRGALLGVTLAAAAPLANAHSADTGKPVLGVGIESPPGQLQGALVALVAADSPAARAGLRPRDLIVQADFQPILCASELAAYVAAHRAGDRLTLTVVRWNGAEPARLQLTATLAAASAQSNQGSSAAHASAPPPQPVAPAAAPAQGLAQVSWTTFTDRAQLIPANLPHARAQKRAIEAAACSAMNRSILAP